jgi:hypothetical protein
METILDHLVSQSFYYISDLYYEAQTKDYGDKQSLSYPFAVCQAQWEHSSYMDSTAEMKSWTLLASFNLSQLSRVLSIHLLKVRKGHSQVPTSREVIFMCKALWWLQRLCSYWLWSALCRLTNVVGFVSYKAFCILSGFGLSLTRQCYGSSSEFKS